MESKRLFSLHLLSAIVFSLVFFVPICTVSAERDAEIPEAVTPETAGVGGVTDKPADAAPGTEMQQGGEAGAGAGAPAPSDKKRQAKIDKFREQIGALCEKYPNECEKTGAKDKVESAITDAGSGGGGGSAAGDAGKGADGKSGGDSGGQGEGGSGKKPTDKEVEDLRKKADEAKAKEQSTANKMLGGLTIGATGIGGMQLMQGLAEKKADEEAAAEMTAYLATIKCGVSGGVQNVKYNQPGKTPEDTRQLVDSRLEYTTIAQKMKSAKENLDLAPGIESELIIDTTQGLYDNAGTDTDGIAHHFDTATERAESGAGKKRAMIGGVLAGAGVIGGVVGNAAINGDGPLGGIVGKLKDKLGGDKAEEEKIEPTADEKQYPEIIKAGIYPNYYIGHKCSTKYRNSMGEKEKDIGTESGQYCWCQLERKSDKEKGTEWVFAKNNSCSSGGNNCGQACVTHANTESSFRNALVSTMPKDPEP